MMVLMLARRKLLMSWLMLTKEVLKMQLKKTKTISRMSLIKEKSLTLLMRLEVGETIGKSKLSCHSVRISNSSDTRLIDLKIRVWLWTWFLGVYKAWLPGVIHLVLTLYLTLSLPGWGWKITPYQKIQNKHKRLYYYVLLCKTIYFRSLSNKRREYETSEYGSNRNQR